MCLNEILKSINEKGILDEDATEAAKARQKILAKPTGALGRLEDISVQMAGITGKVKNSTNKKAIIIMSADNGVTEEGVASAPQSVTLSQTINFTRRLTGVGSMAKHFGIDLLVIDVGVKLPIPESLYTD
ncbi:MAG: nicotinate-nucleotide--dimethylbenzimidazole phosphoribosyltransferase, partial [Anaerovoracaceae bacterium]